MNGLGWTDGHARMDGWRLRFVYVVALPASSRARVEWRLAHQRALREAHGEHLDGNESVYGLSVPPRIPRSYR